MELYPADRAILHSLTRGDRTPAWLAEELGFDRHYVWARLGELEDQALVANIGKGLYTLKDYTSWRRPYSPKRP